MQGDSGELSVFQEAVFMSSCPMGFRLALAGLRLVHPVPGHSMREVNTECRPRIVVSVRVHSCPIHSSMDANLAAILDVVWMQYAHALRRVH